MFSNQNWKVKLAYAGFGCLLGSICTIMGMLASPVTAQRDKFGDIECTSLNVVDTKGNVMARFYSDSYSGVIHVIEKKHGLTTVELGADVRGGRVSVLGEDGNRGVLVGVGGRGGFVEVVGKVGKAGSVLGVDGHGGSVRVLGKDGKQAAWLDVNEYGGWVGASSKDKKSMAELSTGEDGGFVGVYGADRNRRAWLEVAEDGGSVGVWDLGKGQTVMGINGVSTWDKNGYRQ